MRTEEIASWTEDSGEEWWGCPECHSAVGEIKPCINCGSYEHDLDCNYCAECRDEVQDKFEKLLKNNFTEKEIEILEDCIERIGEWNI
jgi:hypothetical protein